MAEKPEKPVITCTALNSVEKFDASGEYISSESTLVPYEAPLTPQAIRDYDAKTKDRALALDEIGSIGEVLYDDPNTLNTVSRMVGDIDLTNVGAVTIEVGGKGKERARIKLRSAADVCEGNLPPPLLNHAKTSTANKPVQSSRIVTDDKTPDKDLVRVDCDMPLTPDNIINQDAHTKKSALDYIKPRLLDDPTTLAAVSRMITDIDLTNVGAVTLEIGGSGQKRTRIELHSVADVCEGNLAAPLPNQAKKSTTNGPGHGN